MNFATIRNTRRILAGMNYTGLDRIYQQLDGELGMVLTLHHVNPHPVPRFAPNAHLTIHPEFLRSVIELLQQRDIDIIDLDEACQRIENPTLDRRRFAVITFDDGYQDTLHHAVPVLKQFDLPYTVYLAPGLIEGTADLWWEAVEALVNQQPRIALQMVGSKSGPKELNCSTRAEKNESFNFLMKYLINDVSELDQARVVRELCWLYKIDLEALNKSQIMSWEQVHRLIKDPKCTIGAHTLNHRALARLTPEQARDEVTQGAMVMASELGHRPEHFAYPYGYRAAAGRRDFAMLKELGFKTAVTTRGGMIFPGHKNHMTALPRISVNGMYQKMRYFAPLTSGLPTRLGNGLKRVSTG
ncbi:MAG: polysaccharide deacetylase family protein [Rhizobiaceae bacterium]